MSRDYWAIACRAQLAAVRGIITDFFSQYGSIEAVDEPSGAPHERLFPAERDGRTMPYPSL